MSQSRDPKTAEAMEIVGEERRKKGFSLKPLTHADQLRSRGGEALARLLENQQISSIMRAYRHMDEVAMVRQAKFKRLCAWTLSAVAVLTYVSFVFLVGLALPLSEDQQHSVRLLALAVIYGGILVGFAGMTWLHYAKPDVGWRQTRADAEVQRAHIFDAVMNADRDKMELLPQKLEYVRRYQLDLQEDYYKWRGEQHRSKVRWSFRRKLVFFIFALLAVAAMAATHFLDKGENGVSAMGESLLGMLLNWEAAYTDLALLLLALALAMWWAVSHTLAQIDGAARNAALYEIAYQKLAALRKSGLEAARKAAVPGNEQDEDRVRRFVSDLQSVLTSEHQGWVALEQAEPTPMRA